MVIVLATIRAHPIASREQLLDDVSAQKTVCAGYQCKFRNGNTSDRK
jgi:hypothetical protein